ncbi:MAG: DUF4276 family protein [Planctomycetaceae bacterium]|nr:DUF4276 family protein [Planctomycetaceae bacterium]
MNEIVAIVEGETEQTFVRDQIAAHLACLGITIWAVLPGRNRRRGGVKKWDVAKQDILRTLRERRFCTTMFDYYAMPTDWPGRLESANLPWEQRADHVESLVLAEVAAAMGDSFDPRYFIPYVQLHEFEALAFADVEKLASVVAPLGYQAVDRLSVQFQRIVDEAGHPEAINDSYETCPSRRITKIEHAYRKRVHGPIVTGRIGLDVLRRECQHFASWLDRLENTKGEVKS